MSTTEIVPIRDAATTEARLRKLERELSQARAELSNLLEINAPLTPQSGEFPQVNGISIFGESIQLHGQLGGDHLIFVDFKKRYDLEERIRRAQEAGREQIGRAHV